MNKLKDIYIWPILIVAYCASRLVNLKIIPIFTDEAIYARWAHIAAYDTSNRFISLEDGKQPLFIWVAGVLNRFVQDPLIAIRLVSVLSGLGSLIGIFLLTSEIFNKKFAYIAAVLYLISPFTLLYDRMGLYDSMLTMLGIYSVYFLVKMAKEPKLDLAFLSALSIGSSLLTKSSGYFFLYYIPITLLFFDLKAIFKTKFIRWCAYSILVVLVSLLTYNILRLSPLFYVIGRKNLEFIRPISEVIKNPFLFTFSNIKSQTTWLITYLSWPLSLLALYGLFLMFKKKSKELFFLYIVVLMPFFAIAVFNKVLYPRFLLFFTPYILIIASYCLYHLYQTLRNKIPFIALLVVSLSIPIYSSLAIIFAPTRALIPASDSSQFLNDWPSGYGVSEVRDYLASESKNAKVVVGTQGTFGLLPYALEIYFYNNPNVKLVGIWPLDPELLPESLTLSSKINKTFIILNENQSEINNPHLKPIAKYRKGIGTKYMRLFQVI